jgi:hypothetical protein
MIASVAGRRFGGGGACFFFDEVDLVDDNGQGCPFYHRATGMMPALHYLARATAIR